MVRQHVLPDPDACDSPALGLEYLHGEPVDVDPLALGGHPAEGAPAGSRRPSSNPARSTTTPNWSSSSRHVGLAADDEDAVAFVDDWLGLRVVLVADLTDDLFDQILEGDEPRRAAVLVDDDGALDALALELLQQVRYDLGLRDEMGGTEELADLGWAPSA